MIRTTIARWLDSDRPPVIGSAISLALGLFFTFVWAPHPWGWQGIDSYHELARVLARGDQFPTTDVPWGYAYYAAVFYAIFGERLWVPLLGQVIANAFVPILLYRLVRPLADRRTAALASLIVGVFSFNTVYASTEASDAICTVLFLCGLLAFSKGWRRSSVAAFAVSGFLFGVVPQFRPNLVLLPAVMIGGYVLWMRLSRRALAHAVVFGVIVAALQMPWIVRNYRLTGLILPTSTHGGVQLWYGTLQVGEHLESRAHNPRTYFASAAFPYTSLWQRPVVITSVRRSCFDDPAIVTQLVYRTDRDPQPRRVAAHSDLSAPDNLTFEVPAQPNGTVLYYWFEQARPATAGTPPVSFTSPAAGSSNPYVFFISDDHLGDLDRHGDVLDVFDVIRLLRHLAWQEPIADIAHLDVNRDGAIDAADLDAMIRLSIPEMAARATTAPLARIERDEAAVTLRLADGSWLSVPREFSGKQTDLSLSLDGEMAPALISRTRTWTSLAHPERRPLPGECVPAGEVTINTAFNYAEPHMMQRYMALALDNIKRDPLAFISASVYRMMRLFVVRGTSDLSTAQQFRWSGVVYGIGTVLSIAYLAAFLAGVAVAFRRRSALLVMLVPIIYVPVTIGFVLTNMRYSVTVQPLMFAFLAMAIVAALNLRPAGRDVTESKT
jgi:hypothetical protein